MPSGVIRLRNSKKSQPNVREYIPVADTSGYNEVDFRDDSVLRKDVHPNTWAPEGQNPRAPYPVVKGQGYHREMTIVGPRASEPISAPKKSSKHVFQASHLDTPTKPALSNEEPVRNEGPPATHRGRFRSSK